ncbi:MAG: hypothetical protein HY852_04910 [Bradyrhizobium sp.]|uniref:hypothetical protein n=1 Tax=Bradyrhizobium sp. TaxID=376 RepID=UPI0025BAF837|nr:hypothetical protein [Bradyrhizobium sp.]MBI5261141.1 hypothetical protein [Bradyrhizobium sp.]
MSKDGKYAAWFRTKYGQGTGIVYLKNGEISGGDGFFTYAGSYEIDQERFTATLTTKRHADGPSTVFGLDEVEVTLTGQVKGAIATCTGSAKQAPGVVFEATLIPSQDDKPAFDLKHTVLKLNPDKLPKGLDFRSRTRNPFGL